MKAIIKGTRYDTANAILIGEATHAPVRDYTHWEAGLYRTPRGTSHFLAGRGGPMTQFADVVDHTTRRAGERIIPLSEADALEWAEQYLEPEEVERGFGSVIRDA